MEQQAMAANLLDVEHLKTYFFTRAGIVKAVDDVSFTVQPGQTLGIVGESGSGKSVTALSIMRLIASPPGKIVDGAIQFEGDNILEKNQAELTELRGSKISMIFQDPMSSLNPVFTVGYQIAETVKRHRKGISNDQAWRRAIEMLDLVRIPDARRRARNYPHEFSGGMRQRVMIAIALVCNPRLLIADEPTTALDVTIQAQVLDLIKGLSHDFGTAVLLITHDLAVVAGTCQYVNVMYAGHIVEAAPVKQIFETPAHPYTVGLLRSIPRLDETRSARLTPIKGQPPDPANLPTGCPYASRCPKVQNRCLQERPPLMPVGRGDQVAACFYPNEGELEGYGTTG
jgi:oligopeptide/dipeptide ABC transporter ATP-binding protein